MVEAIKEEDLGGEGRMTSREVGGASKWSKSMVW